MKRRFLTTLLCCCPLVLLAGEIEYGEKRGDDKKLPELLDYAEHLAMHGPLVDRVFSRDTDDFSRDLYRVGGMVHYASPNEFLALGVGHQKFRQGGWSGQVNSIMLAGRRINRLTAEGLSGQLGVTTNTEKKTWHGEGTWNVRLTPQLGMELIGNRDAVETVRALGQGIMANFAAVSVDYALTDRLTVIGMPTYRHFSDGNEQRGGRAWLIYALLPEQGISLQGRAQNYRSSAPDNGGMYFSPDHYERYETGVRLRRSLGPWRVFASADWGHERVDRDLRKPTRAFMLSAQRSIVDWMIAGIQFSYYEASSSGTTFDASDAYAWRMGRLYLAIPF